MYLLLKGVRHADKTQITQECALAGYAKWIQSFPLNLLHPAQKHNVVDIRSGRTGFQEIAERIEKGV
jgi:hypothetical protein